MEKGNDQMMVDMGIDLDDTLAVTDFKQEQERQAAEEAHLSGQSMPVVDDEPGEDYPAPDFSDADDPDAKEPAPDFDPLPPQTEELEEPT